MTEGKILIVDDNRTVLRALELALQPEFSSITTFSNPNRLPFFLQSEKVDAILLDMNFIAGVNSGNEGLFWLGEIKKHAPDVQVIMITAYGDVDLAVKALKQGASDFVLKPWDNARLIETLKSAIRFKQSHEKHNIKTKPDEIASKSAEKVNFIGSSTVMRDVSRVIEKVAVTDANVLITGENGTGKELIAQQLHKLSGRTDKVMVSVDMGAISETLFESELFGHVKGAFTDARTDREGKISAANSGTLFLDEIGNLSLPLQAKLLAVLENRRVIPVGANKPIIIDIRLICATNMDLEQMVGDGLFREDLLFRINTIRIEAPPLRDREEDIVLLARNFLNYYGKKYKKDGLSVSGRACEKLRRYFWPGNVRELRHAMEKAVILSDNKILQPEDFHFRPTQDSEETPATLEDMERTMIEKALKESDNNISAAAGKLGITRQTLYNKVKKHGI
jgi:DNA-binding NtrC family response regulator